MSQNFSLVHLQADRIRAARHPAAMLASFLIFLVVDAASCASTGLGASDVDLARGRGRAMQGADVFAKECARCHGGRGEGLAGAPAILGPGALPEYPRENSPGSSMPTDQQQMQFQILSRPGGAAWRDPFRTAQDLRDFVQPHLPKSRAGQVGAEGYWALVTFMLAVQGAQVPPDGVHEGNAAGVPVPH